MSTLTPRSYSRYQNLTADVTQVTQSDCSILTSSMRPSVRSTARTAHLTGARQVVNQNLALPAMFGTVASDPDGLAAGDGWTGETVELRWRARPMEQQTATGTQA